MPLYGGPLWRPPGYGGPEDVSTNYIYSKINIIFHQALMAHLVKGLNLDQKAMGLSPTFGNKTRRDF